MKARRWLVVAGASMALLAGCTGGDPEEQAATPRADAHEHVSPSPIGPAPASAMPSPDEVEGQEVEVREQVLGSVAHTGA